MFFLQNRAFKIARKMQKLPILRDKSIQNVIFCVQTFFQNLPSKSNFFFKIVLFKNLFSMKIVLFKNRFFFQI